MSALGTGFGTTMPFNLNGAQSQMTSPMGGLGMQSLSQTGGASAQAGSSAFSQYGQMGSGGLSGLGGGGGNILGMMVQIMSLMVSMLQMLMGGMQGGQSPSGGTGSGSDGSGSGDGSQSGGCPCGGSATPSPAPAPVPAPAPAPAPSPGGGSTGGTQGPDSSQPAPSGNVGDWISQAQKALAASGVPMDKMNAKDIATIIQHESNGDPNAQNNWDSNAQAGTPSIGLMQTIQPTFDANKLPGHDNIRNPVDNIIAGVRYAVSRYGSVSNVPGVQKVNSGGQYVGY